MTVRYNKQFGGASVKTVYGKGSKGKVSHAECISKAEFNELLGQQRAEMTAQFNDLFQRMLRQMSAYSVYISPSTDEIILPTQGSSNTIHPLQTIAFSELFGYDGDAYVYVTDIIDLFKDEWLNVSIIQIFYM
jgi:hypothetical protein